MTEETHQRLLIETQDDKLNVRVVSMEEAASLAQFVVCAFAEQVLSGFEDNVHGECHDCKRAIVWRPHNPPSVPKICIDCMVVRASNGDG